MAQEGPKEAPRRSLETKTLFFHLYTLLPLEQRRKEPGLCSAKWTCAHSPSRLRIGCEMTSPIQVHGSRDWSAEGLGGAKKEKEWVKRKACSVESSWHL